MALADRITEAVSATNDLALPDGVHASLSIRDFGDGTGRAEFNVHCRTVDQLRQARRAVGNVTKERSAGGMKLVGDFSGVKVTIYPPSDACEQVQVGTERRPVTQTVETGEYEDVPVYEWDCGPVLADEREMADA